MSESEVDWQALARLRDGFLDGNAGDLDYWRSERDLASYDATFAQRIGWKWDFVLEELAQRNWAPPAGELVDWGCGSGIAARAFLDQFPAPAGTSVRFVDRSPLAMTFAARRARERFPGITVTTGQPVENPEGIVLLSHVLTELNPSQIVSLLEVLQRAAAVIWVEPGTYEASLALIAIRERLVGAFHPVAPCTHGRRCGILTAGNEPHWCHHFARPPAAVFTDPFWGRFASLLNIDLRSLPLSYLVLDRRPPPAPQPGTARMLGRPRILKAELRVLACTAEGVAERSIARREFPDLYRSARKNRLESLLPPTP